MNIIFTGQGTGGSFQIRGEQLGRAVGATVLAKAVDFAPFDLAVVVKRPRAEIVGPAQRSATMIIWDLVDSWPQPYGNDWTRTDAMRWLSGEMQNVRPAGLVAATAMMASDLAEFGIPVLNLPHHSRPGLRHHAVKSTKSLTIGYEGGEQYIQHWGAIIRRECAARGWSFVVNPPDIADVDALVAMRDQSGYPARCWKSNVKLANAQAACVPIVCCRECGYIETAGPGVLWADNKTELTQALDFIADPINRKRAACTLGEPLKLPEAAAKYKRWLEDVCR